MKMVKLSGEELAEFEAELEKLEQYQAYFEENKPQQPLEISEIEAEENPSEGVSGKRVFKRL